jgi:hypothetical protein
MDQSSHKGSSPQAVDGMGEKRPWAAPALKRLDVGLTNVGNQNKTHFRDGNQGVRS